MTLVVLNPKGRAAFVLTAQPQRVTMWCPCLKRQHKHHGSLPQEANEEATAWKTKTPKEKGTTGPLQQVRKRKEPHLSPP